MYELLKLISFTLLPYFAVKRFSGTGSRFDVCRSPNYSHRHIRLLLPPVDKLFSYNYCHVI